MATAILILQAVAQAIQIGATLEPELVAAFNTAVSLVESTTTPTAEQQATMDAAWASASAALQAAQPAAV